MITIVKTKRLKELKEAERKLKLVELTTGSLQQLREKQKILFQVLNNVANQIAQINKTSFNLKKEFGRNVGEYKKNLKVKR